MYFFPFVHASRQILRPGSCYGFQQLFSGYPMSVVRAQGPVKFLHTFIGLSPTVAQKEAGAGAKKAFPWLMRGLTVTGLGLGLASFNRPPILCDSKFFYKFQTSSRLTFRHFQKVHPNQTRLTLKILERPIFPLHQLRLCLFMNSVSVLWPGSARESSSRKVPNWLLGS
jgi:hypothetical protein